MLKIKDLNVFFGGIHALKGISFDVPIGKVITLIGANGAGKSTTQKVLNGLLKGFSGSVHINGTDLSSMERSFYEKIGVAFEFPNLYLKLTALENLQLFASFFKSKTRDPDELLQMVHLEGDRDTRVEAFSKGMKMRLSFIRALLNRPELIFLDEPTAGLDPGNARIMKDIILDLQKQGVTIFLTTHHMDDAGELCNRLAFMVEGTLPVIDSTKDLRLRHGKKTVRLEYMADGEYCSKDFPLDHLGSNPSFSEILQNNEIQTIHTQEASLEDIFIKITGKQLKQ